MSEIPIQPNLPNETEEDRMLRTIQNMGVLNVRGLHFPGVEESEGRYLQARLRLNDAILEAAYQRFIDQTGIGISDDAKNLIRIALNAILSDPHPRWEATTEERVKVIGRYVSQIPKHLKKVVKDENVSGQITTFDLLFWAAREEHLFKLCIID